MLISIRHPYSGKTALYYNRYDSVTVKIYRLLRRPSADYSGHHLYPLLSFFGFLEASGYVVTLHRTMLEEHIGKVELIFSHDLSRNSINAVSHMRMLHPSFRAVLLVCEHPDYQKQIFNASVLDLFNNIYTSMDIPHRSVRSVFSPYVFRQIPCVDSPIICQDDAVCDVALISSNLPNWFSTTYGLRRHIINVLSELDCLSFAFYGRGWSLPDYLGNFRMLAKYSFSNISHSTRLTAHSLAKYGGEILDKQLLASAKCCLSIENSLSPTGYITEKLIEPLVYGSIPIYMGSILSSEICQILPSPAIRFLTNNDATSIVKSCLEVSVMSHDESKVLALSMRSAMNTYLEAMNYPTGLWMIAQDIVACLS